MPPTVVLTWLFMLLQILAVRFPRHLLGRMHLCRHARKALLHQKCSLYMHAT